MPESSMQYSFSCAGAPKDAFAVVSFTGREAVSECYEFEIVLVASRDLDLVALMESRAVFDMAGAGRDVLRHGVVTGVEQQQEVEDQALYTVRLAPRLAMLDYARRSQIFLDKTLPQIIEAVFKQAHLADYTLELQGDYPAMEYVCQYNETHYEFLSRWMESRGLYFFFQQGEYGEVVVVTDTKAAHQPCIQQSLLYAPPSGLNDPGRGRALASLVSRRSTAPSKIRLKGYDYLKPSLDIDGLADVAQSGLGECYTYGDDFRTPSEGRSLAKVRAEERACRRRVFFGQTAAPGLGAGYEVDVEQHFRSDCNGKLFLVEVEHAGRQPGRLPAGLDGVDQGLERQPDYEARFTAIPAQTQHRPRPGRSKPAIRGVINAVVETEGTGEYAMLDDQGRYKVRLPFDLSDNPNTHASCWLRKAEPYAGAGHGMHFPLQAGAEVLLDFLGGDIDRPYIAAAAHNAEARNQVTSANAAANVIRSAGNNQVVLGDKRGQEYISLWSPFHKSGISIGSVVKGGGGSINQSTEGGFDSFTWGDSNDVTVGASNSAVGGFKNFVVVGASNTVFGGISASVTGGIELSGALGWKMSMGDEAYSLKTKNSMNGFSELTLKGGFSSTVSRLSKEAVGALVTAMAGAGLGAAGASFLAERQGDGGMTGDGVVSPKTAEAVGTVGTVLGSLGSIAASVWAVTLVKRIESLGKSQAAGQISLNKDGAAITVNNRASSSANLTLLQSMNSALPQSPGLPSSAIKMTNQGMNLTLENNYKAKLTMDSGSSIAISVDDAAGSVTLNVQDTGGKITVDANQLVLEKSDGGKATIDASGATMEMANGAKASVTAEEAKLESGSDSISVNGSQGITLNFGGGKLGAGPLSINQAGVIQMG